MRIRINGELEQLDGQDVCITDLLALKKVESPEMVSVQLNGDIIERGHYQTQTVRDGDELDFLYFMGGGSW